LRACSFEVIRDFLEIMHDRTKKGAGEKLRKSAMGVIRPIGLPQQAAGSVDCGVFLVKYAEMFLAKPPAENKLRRGVQWKEWYEGMDKRGGKIREAIVKLIRAKTDKNIWKEFEKYNEVMRTKELKRKSSTRTRSTEVLTLDSDGEREEKERNKGKTNEPGPVEQQSSSSYAASVAASRDFTYEDAIRFSPSDVKVWMLKITNDERIANSFVHKEIDGKILLGFSKTDLFYRLNLCPDTVKKVLAEIERVRSLAPSCSKEHNGEPPAKTRKIEQPIATDRFLPLGLTVDQLHAWIMQKTGDNGAADLLKKARVDGDTLVQQSEPNLTRKYGLSSQSAKAVHDAVIGVEEDEYMEN
ncbi:hypothetical protein PMAYCL1PPCAC_08185, partial [Pristionchus mayeri]